MELRLHCKLSNFLETLLPIISHSASFQLHATQQFKSLSNLQLCANYALQRAKSTHALTSLQRFLFQGYHQMTARIQLLNSIRILFLQLAVTAKKVINNNFFGLAWWNHPYQYMRLSVMKTFFTGHVIIWIIGDRKVLIYKTWPLPYETQTLLLSYFIQINSTGCKNYFIIS